MQKTVPGNNRSDESSCKVKNSSTCYRRAIGECGPVIRWDLLTEVYCSHSKIMVNQSVIQAYFSWFWLGPMTLVRVTFNSKDYPAKLDNCTLSAL